MRRIIIAYLATAVIMLAGDLLWLGSVGTSFYRPRLPGMLLDQPVWYAAAIFYLVYLAGVQLFVVFPALEVGSWLRALALGAAFGAVAYLTYDMSNLATLRGWSPAVAFLDIGWGAALTAVSSVAGFGMARWLG